MQRRALAEAAAQRRVGTGRVHADDLDPLLDHVLAGFGGEERILPAVVGRAPHPVRARAHEEHVDLAHLRRIRLEVLHVDLRQRLALQVDRQARSHPALERHLVDRDAAGMVMAGRVHMGPAVQVHRNEVLIAAGVLHAEARHGELLILLPRPFRDCHAGPEVPAQVVPPLHRVLSNLEFRLRRRTRQLSEPPLRVRPTTDLSDAGAP